MTKSALNQPDHDILIELKTMVNILMGKFEDTNKNYLLLANRVEILEKNALGDQFPTRISALEKIVTDLPVKPDELTLLVSWTQSFKERYKLFLSVLMVGSVTIGFILGRMADIMHLIK